MTLDLAFDQVASGYPEPRLEHVGRRTPVGGRQPDDQFVLVRAAHPLDTRPANAGPGWFEPEPVQRAAKPKLSAIPEAAARRQPGTFAGLAVEVPPQPRLALGQEPVHLAAAGRTSLDDRTAAPSPRRHDPGG